MSATLVIVTANFPFAHKGGELAFVGPEIACLATALGARIVIAPLHATGSRLPLPEGVEVDTRLSQGLRHGWVWNSLRACAWPGFWRELWRAARVGGPVGMARAWRWAAVAQATWHWARPAWGIASAVIFYTYWRGGATLALARLAQQREGCAAVTRVHGFDLYEERFQPAFQPWPATYREVAFSVAISAHGRGYLLDRHVAPERVVLHRLGTRASAAGVSAASQDGCARIVSCSMVVGLKRVPTMASALVSLAARHPQRQFRWTHFGDGPDLPAVRAALAAATSNLAVDLPGEVANVTVVGHYAAQPVDVFLLLSRTEGLPVVIVEALAAGVPIIATDVGGVSEAVGPDNGELLAANPALADVVAALERVLLTSSASESAARRRRSRERWERDFDAELNHRAFAQRLRQLFDRLSTP